MPNCIICQMPDVGVLPQGAFARFDCSRCGSFLLSGTAEAVLQGLFAEDPLRRSLMSHTLRRMQRTDDGHLRVIKSDDLPTFWSEGRLPTPQQQADNLILWIGDNQRTPNHVLAVKSEAISAIVGTALSSTNADWMWLNTELAPLKLYEFHMALGAPQLRLTMEGWKKYEELKRVKINSRLAFMAMKFGDPELDRAVETCFKPAVARTGFELRKLTDQQPAGLIDDQIRAALLSGRFVIADLTHGSHGAYWEAGYAEGLGLPVIYTCQKSVWDRQSTHFDTNHMNTIIWHESNLERAQDALTATIRATLRAEARQTD
jgi:hypothetical protein